MVEIVTLRHEWPEKAGFVINRPLGYPKYTLLHFFNSVELLLGEKMVTTEPHACIIYNIGTPQRYVSHMPLTHDWMHFEGDLSPIFSKYGLSVDTLYYPSNSSFITDIISEMENEFFSHRPQWKQLLSIKTDELFLKLARACQKQYTLTVDSSTEERFYNLRSKIFSELAHKWTIDEMASMVGLSESRFFSLYKNLYGISPINDLIRARLDAAISALENSSKSISEIAGSLGYDNLPHFIRQFHRYVGMSPNAYKIQYQKEKEQLTTLNRSLPKDIK